MYVIYNTITGQDVSRTARLESVANPLPVGLSVKLVTDPADGFIWSNTLLDFVSPPTPRIIGQTAFIERFTLPEQQDFLGVAFGTLTNGQKKNVMTFLWYLMLLDVVRLDSPAIIAGVNYLQTVGIIAAGRAAQVLA